MAVPPAPSNILTIKSSRSSLRHSIIHDDSLLFEACERRLVLSAQLLFDVLGDQALDLHAEGLNAAGSTPLELHVQESLAATGLNSLRAEFGLTGAGQTVAVIDSGVTWDHVALGQGFGPGYRVVGGWDFAENDDRPYDDGPAGFHGTHVTGIIASDDLAHPGVAPGVDLVALRVFNDMGEGRLEWIENALRWVQDNQHSFENPITTVNISIGTQWNDDGLPAWATLEEELQQLHDSGIVVTASAGNSFDGSHPLGLSYPAASQYVLPVASVDENGQLSSFSQRNERVLAAPGSNITSTIPDHVLGRDGIINDFSAASGTSMSAPYVAGASVLVRQAMEMTGWDSITADSITEHLRSTADHVFDSVTGLSFDRINLDHAIDSLIPDDAVGDTTETALTIDLTQGRIDTWINSLHDTDVFRFQATANGILTLDAASDWLSSASWELRTLDHSVAAGHMDPKSFQVVAGQAYELSVTGDGAIGPLSFEANFEASVDAGGNSHSGSGEDIPHAVSADLGAIRYAENTLTAGTGYSVTATQNGTFTVQWTTPDPPDGALFVTDAAGQVYHDSTWEAGTLRLDVQVVAGEQLVVSLPGSTADTGQLALANVLEQSGTAATVTGTLEADQLSLNLNDGVKVAFGAVEYAFAEGEINELHLEGYGSNDTLHITGSPHLDKVNLRPTGSTLDSQEVHVVIASIEQISYTSGGGADRVYLYDSDTDDSLIARPGEAELVGVGYRFEVAQVERIFIHATGGGQDIAYLYDSPGDDHLSIRPQFSSISGDGFFNYVRGFDRVHAYASAGGFDTAELYDSAHNDRFFTSGISASMVGPGFSSFTRAFEQVNAHASAGGFDVANLYGSDTQTEWRQGSDFISFHEANWTREARGFQEVGTFVDGQATAIVTPASQGVPGNLATLANQPEVHSEQVGIPPVGPAEGEANAFAANQPFRSGPSLETLVIDSHALSPAFANAGHALPDTHEVLSHEVRSVTDWTTATEYSSMHGSLRDALASKLHLPEERLLDDEQLERKVLDEAFRQFEELF